MKKTREVIKEELLKEGSTGYDLKGIASELVTYFYDNAGNSFDQGHFIENLGDEYDVDEDSAQDMLNVIMDELLSEKSILKILKRDY